MKTVRESWTTFARDTIPPSAPLTHRDMLRRAYYAGCWAMLQDLKALGDDATSEDAGVAVLEALEAELREFQRNVREGRA